MIAGSGNLPFILAQELNNSGNDLITISITKSADTRLALFSSNFFQIGIGQVKKIINTLKETEAEEIVIMGKISKSLLFKPLNLDIKSVKILSKLKDRNDSSIFKAIADEFEQASLKLIDQRTYLARLLPQKGVLTRHQPSKAEWLDIEYGMDLAKKTANLGIGQTVIIKDQIILSVEAIEGTDEAIRRGGKLCDKGVVVAKAAKPDQDFRFDVPTIGPDTIDVLIESKANAISIEYGKAFLLEPEITIPQADAAKIAIVVI